MAENPESLLSTVNAVAGAAGALGMDRAVAAMRHQIRLHDETDSDKTALDKVIDFVWHKDDTTLAKLKQLEGSVEQNLKQANPAADRGLSAEITRATSDDQQAMLLQNSVEYYGGSFLKAVPLFAGRSKMLLAASIGFNALDAVRMHDTGSQTAADLALGGLKGFALKKTFDVIGAGKLMAEGGEKSASQLALSLAGTGLKGVTIGGLSRFYESSLNRQNWTDSAGGIDPLKALSAGTRSALDPTSMALDATVFVGARGITSGLSRLGSAALSASPALQKLQSTEIGAFVKESGIIPSSTMGATFGFSSGAVAEISRERQTGSGLDLSKILKRGSLEAITDAAAGATGAGASRLAAQSGPTTDFSPSSTANHPRPVWHAQEAVGFGGQDLPPSQIKFAHDLRLPLAASLIEPARLEVMAGKQTLLPASGADNGSAFKASTAIVPKDLVTWQTPRVQRAMYKAAGDGEAALEKGGKSAPLPDLKLETWPLEKLADVDTGAKPLTDKQWNAALRSGKFAVVLAGGGQQGYHHLGFLAALGERGLTPQSVTGVSAGSTFRALDLGKDASMKWDQTSADDRGLLKSLIDELRPYGEGSRDAGSDGAEPRATMRVKLEDIKKAVDGGQPVKLDQAMTNFLNGAKQAVGQKQLLDQVFDTHPKGVTEVDLTDLAWQNAYPFNKAITGQDLGADAMHGLPRADLTEIWWNNPFNIWRWALGSEVPQGIPHITTWDGSQLDMLPAFRQVDARLNLQAHNNDASSFLAYDVQNNRVVNFQGAGSYPVSTALAASTAINVNGQGVKPVDAIINGQPSKLVDLGVVDNGRYNSPSGQLSADLPALISQLPRPASPRRPNDLVVSYARGERPPFPLVGNSDVLRMYANAYLQTQRILAKYF